MADDLKLIEGVALMVGGELVLNPECCCDECAECVEDGNTFTVEGFGLVEIGLGCSGTIAVSVGGGCGGGGIFLTLAMNCAGQWSLGFGADFGAYAVYSKGDLSSPTGTWTLSEGTGCDFPSEINVS